MFCGGGGLSQGLQDAGFDIVASFDSWNPAIDFYNQNIKGHFAYQQDLSNIEESVARIKKWKPSVIVGGPPCQGFSQKGKRLSLDDPRNYLFQQYVRFVSEFRPKYFVLENVPNIITTSQGYFKNQIIREFEDLGYVVKYGVLRAVDFGVPRDRHRAVFIGQLHENTLSLPLPNGQHTTVKDAIYDLPFIASGEGKEEAEYDKKATTPYQKELRGRCKILYNHVATTHSKIALERLSMIPKGAGKEVLPQEHRTKSIYSGTWSRLLEDGVAATITTRFDTPSSGRFTHPILNRCLTVREAARIQSFPDDFIFYGSKTIQMKEVGNAVPPFLARAIAQEILKNEQL